MTRFKVFAAAAASLSVLALGACGSDTSDPAVATSSEAPPAAPSTTPAATPTKPSPSATTTAAPTTAAPAGDLVEYENADGDGIYLATAADTKNLKGAPAAFKTFIAAELASNAGGDEECPEPAQIYVSRVDTGGWARGGYSIPQCGGYGALWAESQGAWQEVWSGQSLVECATLDRYTFPSRIAGDQCLKGSDAVPYKR